MPELTAAKFNHDKEQSLFETMLSDLPDRLLGHSALDAMIQMEIVTKQFEDKSNES